MNKNFEHKIYVMLTTILTICTININSHAKNLMMNNEINLKADILADENSIGLSWNVKNPTQPFNFKIFKKRGDESNYSALGVGAHKEKVTVLNIYAESSSIPIDGNYTTWDGEEISNLPKSAILKRWMEEPTGENPKGYGRGVIEVVPVSMDSLDSYPDKYLIEKGGDYYTTYNDIEMKIDAIMFGTWDSYSTYAPISSSNVSKIEEYIRKGGPVIFGHDVIRPHTNDGFLEFMPMLDIVAQKPDVDESSNIISVGGRHIQAVKDGTILEFPWSISRSELSIPATHTARQMTRKSDVWIEFSRPDDGDSGIPSYTERLIEFDGYTNNNYLTIKNNLAMIQTGHSNAQATPDEQKILANTLFYMTQVSSTEGTRYKDTMGQDVSPPNKPILGDVNINIDGNNLTFSGTDYQDIGTDYSYYVEGVGKNDGVVVNSNIVSTNIVKGLNGYSFIIDTNPFGVPDNIVDIKSISEEVVYNFNKNSIEPHYLHIKAIDNAGNVSETSHVKLSSLVHEVAISNTEIAEKNPTVENISIARGSINNLPDSYIKDELQNRLNNISPNVSLDKSYISSNLDIYIIREYV